MLRKIEYHYPTAFAKSGLAQGARHFGILSAINATLTSSLFMVRIKGEIERDFPTYGYPHLTFARPGLITNREGERLIEKIGKYIPFIPKVDSDDIALALYEDAILSSEVSQHGEKVRNINNDEIKLFAREFRAQ